MENIVGYYTADAQGSNRAMVWMLAASVTISASRTKTYNENYSSVALKYINDNRPPLDKELNSLFDRDDYLSESCNQNFLNCVHSFQKSRAPTFRGNTCDVKDVVKIIEDVMAAAIAAGKVLGKP
ncbi:hypothetical protein Leryth_001021 [Lithospermum erythrorhizon]|nr:hypothetical protein Leryth_001021 [Lithospermum erythrorhizon]